MVGDGSYLEFKNEDIHNIGSTTGTQSSTYDDIWNRTKAQLGSLVSNALDQLTGSSLEDRSARYHQKAMQYTGELGNQQNAMVNMAQISSETNTNMARTIAG